MKSTESIVGVIPDHQVAEAVVKRPAQAGFEMKNLSVVDEGYPSEEKVVGFYNSGDRIKFWVPRARSPPTAAAFSKPAVHGRGCGKSRRLSGVGAGFNGRDGDPPIDI
jgi:hypothetical protein